MGPSRGLIHVLWLVPVVLGLAYSLLLDWARSWYSVPALMTLTLLSAGALAALLNMPSDVGRVGTNQPRWLLRGLQRLARSSLGLILWAVVLEAGIVFAVPVHKEFADDSKLNNLRGAAWLAANARLGDRIGCWHSGIFGYYVPRIDPAKKIAVINLDGLNNNDILLILRGDRRLNPYFDKIGLTA